jgi:3-oxoacyl-[acyl-carrier protein] reductase
MISRHGKAKSETLRGRKPMDLQLKEKVVLVAGASRGIGLGIVEALLGEGARVALTARGADALKETHERLAKQYGAANVWSQAGDMRDSAFIDSTVERIETEFGPLWGAVANVGLFPCPPGFDVDDATWDGGFAQNLDSAFRLARSSLRRMTPRNAGALVLISSTAGLNAMSTPLTYGTSKAAINHLTKELARLTARSNIRVNAIAPGTVVFPGNNWDKRSTGPDAEAWKRWTKREIPMNRFGHPEEIGSVAAFLLSPVASYLTGAIVPVDGGQTQ